MNVHSKCCTSCNGNWEYIRPGHHFKAWRGKWIHLGGGVPYVTCKFNGDIIDNSDELVKLGAIKP